MEFNIHKASCRPWVLHFSMLLVFLLFDYEVSADTLRTSEEGSVSQLSETRSASQISIGDTITYGGLLFKVTEKNADINEVMLIKSPEAQGEVSIPSTITDESNVSYFTVTAIEDKAFYNCANLTSLFIPASITHIGKAITCCCNNLGSIVVDESNLYYDSREKCNAIIEKETRKLIAGCNNTNIPEGITVIGEEAMRAMYKLKRTHIPNSVKSIEADAFYYCTSLISDISIPEGVTSIGKYAFYNCSKIKTIEIPSTISSLSYRVFKNCDNVTKMKVNWQTPINVSSDFFSNYSNCELIVPKGCVEAYREAKVWKDFKSIKDQDNIIFADQTVKGICISHWDTDGDGELSMDEAAAVTSFGTEFYNNREITSFNEMRFFVNLKTINPNAFKDCRALSAVTFPESLNTIGHDAFFNCESLVEIYIPASVTSIGSSAFSCCIKLNQITVDEENTAYSSYQGSNCIVEAATCRLIAASNNTVIPSGVKVIGIDSFRGLTGITTVHIPNGVTDIEQRAFYYCTAIKELSMPEGLVNIENYAVYKCTNLTSLEIPASVNKINYRAFNGCDNVTSMKVNWQTPFNVSSDFFSNYSNCELIVPNGCVETYKVTDVWKDFKSIKDGENIIFADQTVKGICISHWDTDGDGELSMDEAAAVTSFGTEFYNNREITSFNEMRFFVNLKTINANAFKDCRALSAVTFPESLNTIGHDAFFNCESLVEIYIPASVTSIGNSAFSCCVKLNHITVDEENTAYSSYQGSNCIVETATGRLIAASNNTVIPSGVKVIAIDSFRGLTGITTVHIPNGVTDIEQRAFYYCTAIKELTMPEGLVNIENYAVYKCTSLTSLEIPASVNKISYRAFNGCDNVTSMKVNWQTPFNVSSDFFSNYSKCELTVPEGSVEAYKAANVWKEFMDIHSDATFLLTIQSSSGGTVGYNNIYLSDNSQTFSIREGDEVILSFSPNEGYELSKLTSNETDVISSVIDNHYTISSISTNTTLAVQFAKKNYTLSIQSVGNGQVVYDTQTIRNKSQSFSIEHGSSATIALSPDNGQRISSLSVNGTNVTSLISNNQYTISDITSTTVVVVVFETIPIISYKMSVNCSDGGSVFYNGIKNPQEINVSDGSLITLDIIPDTGYELSNLLINGSDVTELISEDKYSFTVSSDIIISANFIKRNFKLLVEASGNGTVYYNNTPVTNDTKPFDVEYGASVTLDITPNKGHKILSVSFNNIDVTANVDKYVYTTPSISDNSTVKVVFGIEGVYFVENGIQYGIISSEDSTEVGTIAVQKYDYWGYLKIPSTVLHDDITYIVTQISDSAFYDNPNLITVSIPESIENCGKDIFGKCERLSAIIWQPQKPLSTEQFGKGYYNQNLLFYTSQKDYAPEGITNIVEKGHASIIKLLEDYDFYCPQTFTTDKVTYTHKYSMVTGIGESKGWETIVLPFDVKTITHETKGDIVPFAAYSTDSGAHPFWLYGYDNEKGFIEATAIKANCPYIISMPNNERYAEEYILKGNVEFWSENVTIETSDGLQSVVYRNNEFCPTYQKMPESSEVKALNMKKVTYKGYEYEPGSAFLPDIREVRPFEAYMKSTSGSRAPVTIFDELSTAIGDIPVVNKSFGQFKIYNTAGQLVRTFEGKGEKEAIRGLSPGIYVINGHKKVVK